ncbi:MAG: hypothetical protein ACOXZI_06600 [Candidatus Cryptobacteroides sp.]|jgi:hypothetical protein
MNKLLKLLSSVALISIPFIAISACSKEPSEKETPEEEAVDKYPSKQIFSDIPFRYSDTPYSEPVADIISREIRLNKREKEFYAQLDNAIANGSIDSWMNKYHKEFTSETYSPEPYTVLIMEVMKQDKYKDGLKDWIVSWLKANILTNQNIFNDEVAKDLSIGRSGLIFDLNTVHPVRYLLESAYALRLLDSYDTQTENLVKKFIEDNIENKVNYYTGDYRTSGYNKEIFAMDIAFWVKMLYGDEYYHTNLGFENIWTNVTVSSYDADNSPHYDSGTGFYLILRWGEFLGRENELKASQHIFRIMDRMARTVMTSGISGKWGKSMENLYSNNKELATDGGRTLAWCLKMGYRIYGDINYLYIARKYEDLRFNSRNISRWKGTVCDLWPSGINYARVSARPTDDFGLVHKTTRIASKGVHNGTMLGRGVTTYLTQQDKIVLSTGTHPDAPCLLVDMSISASKAAQDHRLGINMSIFKGAHVCSYLGRPGEPFRLNRPYVAPASLSGFPVFDIPQGDVNPTSDYTNRLGYYYQTDYTIESYEAATLSKNAAYCEINYSRLQYIGVNATRKIVLLHNGIIAVYDILENNADIKYNAADIYTLWPDVSQSGERWALQSSHIPTTVNTPAVQELPILFCFPITSSSTIMNIDIDNNRTSYENGKTKTLSIKAEKPIGKGECLEIITIIVPVKSLGDIDNFVEQIICSKVDEGYLLYIPSSETNAIKILFNNEGAPIVE